MYAQTLDTFSADEMLVETWQRAGFEKPRSRVYFLPRSSKFPHREKCSRFVSENSELARHGAINSPLLPEYFIKLTQTSQEAWPDQFPKTWNVRFVDVLFKSVSQSQGT